MLTFNFKNCKNQNQKIQLFSKIKNKITSKILYLEIIIKSTCYRIINSFFTNNLEDLQRNFTF